MSKHLRRQGIKIESWFVQADIAGMNEDEALRFKELKIEMWRLIKKDKQLFNELKLENRGRNQKKASVEGT